MQLQKDGFSPDCFPHRTMTPSKPPRRMKTCSEGTTSLEWDDKESLNGHAIYRGASFKIQLSHDAFKKEKWSSELSVAGVLHCMTRRPRGGPPTFHTADLCNQVRGSTVVENRSDSRSLAAY